MKNKNKQTKFPVVCTIILCFPSLTNLTAQARIKKIMQKDEEVGKVAQATPVVICSCFFILFTGSS
jgi:hypothetical protein